MERGGGFVPSEVRYPGPLTQPYACTLAGAQTSSHRAPISRRVGEEKRRTIRGLLFPKLGSHSAFLLERDRGSSEKRRARGVHAGTRERAGVPDLARHGAASLFQMDSSRTMLTPERRDLRKMDAALWRR